MPIRWHQSLSSNKRDSFIQILLCYLPRGVAPSAETLSPSTLGFVRSYFCSLYAKTTAANEALLLPQMFVAADGPVNEAAPVIMSSLQKIFLPMSTGPVRYLSGTFQTEFGPAVPTAGSPALLSIYLQKNNKTNPNPNERKRNGKKRGNETNEADEQTARTALMTLSMWLAIIYYYCEDFEAYQSQQG